MTRKDIEKLKEEACARRLLVEEAQRGLQEARHEYLEALRELVLECNAQGVSAAKVMEEDS